MLEHIINGNCEAHGSYRECARRHGCFQAVDLAASRMRWRRGGVSSKRFSG
jgi:hypothetical protein